MPAKRTKQRPINKKNIDHPSQSVSEKNFKIRNVAIKLVDIAKHKEKTSLANVDNNNFITSSNCEPEITLDDKRMETSLDVSERIQTTLDNSKKIKTTLNVSDRMKTTLDVSKETETTLEVNERMKTTLDVSERTETALDVSEQIKATLDISKGIKTTLEVNKKIKATLDVNEGTETTLEVNESVKTTSDVSERIKATLDISEETETTLEVNERVKTTLDVSERIETALDISEQIKATLDISKGIKTTLEVNEEIKAILDVSEGTETTLEVNESVKTTTDVSERIETALDVSKRIKATLDVSEETETTLEVNEKVKTDLDVSERIETALDVSERIKAALDVSEGTETTLEINERVKTTLDVSEIIETALDVSEKVNLDVTESTVNECNDKANTSSNISDIIDSSLIFILNKESSISENMCELLFNIDQQTHSNANNELTENNLNGNYMNNNNFVVTENKDSPMHIHNNEELISIDLQDKENINQNMINIGSPIIHAEIKDTHQKISTHFNDCNSKKITPKITENIVCNKSYAILKTTPTNIEMERKRILKSTTRNKYSKFKLSNEKSTSFLNLSNCDDSNKSLKMSETQNTSEYNPTDETQCSSEINNTEVTANDSDINNNSINETNSASESDEYSQLKFNVPGNSACNDLELTAEMSNGPKGDNKKNFCVFCKTLQTKIARHLENKHCDEDQVKDFLNLPKGCAERWHKIASIRKKGNFIFNATKDYNHGKLITVRRPTKETKRNGTNFVNCPYCNGFYAQNNLRHHVQQCKDNKNSSSSSSRQILQNARRVLGRYHPETSRRMRVEILPVLQEDEISKAIRYDRAIILYGNNMCKSQVHQHQNNYIRAHLRLLGRFVLALRNRNSEINTLAAAYDPQFYKTVIEAINDIAEFDYKTNMYKRPTNASTLGTCIKKIGKILDVTYMVDNDLIKRKNVEDFMKIYDVDFSGTVNKVVIETQTKVKRHKKIVLPRTSDIKILSDYLKKKIHENIKVLSKEFSYEVCKALAEATLIAIQVFNRRRAGETERILINDYKNHECACGPNTICKFSTQTGTTHKYVRFTIRGKLNRTVPVLLDAQMFKSIQLLLQFRTNAKVPPNNPFVFGLPSVNKDHYKHLRACKLMRGFASECGAKNISSLRGTALRKHVATKCVDLNLSDNQVTRVANFMGHHEHIHKEIYRQPVAKVDILEMSKILEKAQGVDTTTSNETDVTMNNEKDNLSFNNQDITQTIVDLNEVSTDISQTFVDTNEETIDTSVETKKNKEIPKKKKQEIK
ncbi:uncharacterized protein LOC114946029 [Nylanderia fulva]|uniref:uncharacterized protein LOC114946029 n=1 Tax=Nylanderia fulva TaxID=613905 RepID=UPI0010FADA1C|nr:uncharacterized protein LOC114946029 [Nylanderia fulva]